MRLWRTLLLVLGLLLVGSRPMTAQIVGFTVSGNPAAMTITGVPAAGSQPNSIVNTATTYRITTLFAPRKKITASLNAPMPASTTLLATFAATGGGTSNGPVALDATTRDLVVNIGTTFNTTGAITYTFSATVAAGVLSSNRIVTLTLVNYP